MKLKGLAFTLGVGAAIGAVAVMMMPNNNPVRKLARKTAEKVEDTACKATEKISSAMQM